jgi:hypothetical protein
LCRIICGSASYLLWDQFPRYSNDDILYMIIMGRRTIWAALNNLLLFILDIACTFKFSAHIQAIFDASTRFAVSISLSRWTIHTPRSCATVCLLHPYRIERSSTWRPPSNSHSPSCSMDFSTFSSAYSYSSRYRTCLPQHWFFFASPDTSRSKNHKTAPEERRRLCWDYSHRSSAVDSVFSQAIRGVSRRRGWPEEYPKIPCRRL